MYKQQLFHEVARGTDQSKHLRHIDQEYHSTIKNSGHETNKNEPGKSRGKDEPGGNEKNYGRVPLCQTLRVLIIKRTYFYVLC
jgi:hypothetical protein